MENTLNKTRKLYSVKNIALIAMLTSLVSAIKYICGFVAGIEFVTLFFALYAVFLPLVVSGTTSLAFVLLCGAMYGTGSWWVMYFFIWPTEVLLGWLLRNFIKKNNFTFALWVGFWGFSIMFWYALHDIVLFDSAYTISQMITSIVPSTIECASNFIIGLLMFYPLKKFFENIGYANGNSIW